MAKIHRVLKLKRSDWFKTYIDFNTKKEKILLIVLKKNIKMMINSVYGKTVENLRKRINVRLVNNASDKKNICKQTKFCFTKFF